MMNTIAFVTNQYSCERIIKSAKEIADLNESLLVVVAIHDYQYEMNPQAVDFLFSKSKENSASMRLLFDQDAATVMRDIINQYDCQSVVTGMPSTNQSIIYQLWKEFPNKKFYAIDTDGKAIEVENTKYARALK